jgi:hypothetical protein|tara:strand:+ start:1298 stop:1522 length:225 start_codon:yes stop_codon:yes gene_type:complete
MHANQNHSPLIRHYVTNEACREVWTAFRIRKSNISAIIDRKSRLIKEFADDRIEALNDTQFTLYEERASFQTVV